MKHIRRLIQQDTSLRDIDYQRLVQRAKLDPDDTWDELVEASAPIVYTAAQRLAEHLDDGAALAEEATRQVFEAIRDEEFAIIREYVGYGSWPSMLVRMAHEAPVLSGRRRTREYPQAQPSTMTGALDDPDAPVPALDPAIVELMKEEGDRFLDAVLKVVRHLHRRDRLLLSMRYEQGLSLRELDHLFRLGSPGRVGSLLERLRRSLQPIAAVLEAWKVPPEQEESLMRVVIPRIYQSRSMETADEEKVAPALQGR